MSEGIFFERGLLTALLKVPITKPGLAILPDPVFNWKLSWPEFPRLCGNILRFVAIPS